jgi:pyruvate formate lyase activating enzyme
MEYAGFIKQSLVDYPGEIAAVLFTRGCNLRCPFCHNPDLLIKPKNPATPVYDMDEIAVFLAERKGFIDAVVISGGEPTLHPQLQDDIKRIKDLGYLVKLDSNGTNSTVLEELIRAGLVDYVAMDIKAPLEYKRYQQACGRLASSDFFQVRNSINLLNHLSDVQVEFRTTVVPILHTPEHIEDIARYIEGASRYTLQQFNPRVTLDPAYGDVVPFSKEEMADMAKLCKNYVKEVRVVNI